MRLGGKSRAVDIDYIFVHYKFILIDTEFGNLLGYS